MAVPAPNPFDGLPIETTQHIATYLTSDRDLCAFRLVSESMHSAVDADNNSFWRRRFNEVFETPTSWSASDRRSNAVYKRKYQRYRKVLMYGAKFETALGSGSMAARCQGREIRRGTEALEVVRELLCGKIHR